MRFQINNSLIFDEESMTIFYPMGAEELQPAPGTPQARLGSIHSRCFSYLCKRYLENQAIISKKELFFAGWEKHGLVSSNNSLAQTIFQLRRSLKVFDLEHVIVTVPRVGFKLKDLEVKLLSQGSTKPALAPLSSTSTHSYEAGFLRTHLQSVNWSPPLSISLGASFMIVIIFLVGAHYGSFLTP